MNSEEIRARIAEIEAEAERRAQAEAARRHPGAAPTPGAEDDSWESLFDAALRGSGLDNNDFSFGGWLAEGLRGLRAFVRSQGLDDEFWGHLHAAEREFLFACRALIDARLRRAEERAQMGATTGRVQDIEIDF